MKTLLRLLRLLLMSLAGTILVLALLLFFAWLLFPRDFVHRLPKKALNRALPQWQWQIGTVHYSWPLALQLVQVAALPLGRSTAAAGGLYIDSLTFQPDLLFYVRERQWRGTFTAELAGGTLQGSGVMHPQAERQELAVSVSFNAVTLSDLGWLSQMLERQVEGRLSGNLDARLALKNAIPADLQATLNLADGIIPLRNPVLGHDQLPFSKLSLQVKQDGQGLELENGQLDSPLCTGEFAGAVELARPVAASAISVHGVIQARPALFEQVRAQQELQALRLQAARGPLFVRLSGTLHNPALAFEQAAPGSPLPAPEPGKNRRNR